MATYKGTGFDATTGRTRLGTSSDDISFAPLITAADGITISANGIGVTGGTSTDTLTTTGDASIGGDLTVAGDIISRGTVDLVVQDNFIDLNAGNSSTGALSCGFTFSLNRTTGFNIGVVTTFVAGVNGVSNPTFTNTNAGTSTLFTANDIVFISGSDEASNDGLYLITAVSGASFPQTVTIGGVGTVAVSGSLPFCQTQFTADTGDSADAYKVDLKVLAIADGSASFNDAGGSAYAKGTLLEAYASGATKASFGDNGDYTEVGGTSVSLQAAYDTGATILTDATGAIAFTLSTDARGFTVEGSGAGDGNVSIGGTTAVSSYSLNASGSASTINSTGQALTVKTTTSGTLSATSAGMLTMSGVDTTSLTMNASANSIKELTIQANNADVGGSAEARIILDADDKVDLQLAGASIVTLLSASTTIANKIVASDTNGLGFGAGTTVTNIKDEDTMVTNSATMLATQQSIKSYVDSRGISGYGNLLTMTADGTGIAALDVVAVGIGGDAGKAVKADASAISTGQVVGFAIAPIAASAVGTIAQSGSLGGFSGLSAGSRYFLSETTGAITSTAPTSANSVVIQVGWALNATTIAIAPLFLNENG